MQLLKKMMVDKHDISLAIEEYIKNLPDEEWHLYIGVLIITQELNKKHIQKVKIIINLI